MKEKKESMDTLLLLNREHNVMNHTTLDIFKYNSFDSSPD